MLLKTLPTAARRIGLILLAVSLSSLAYTQEATNPEEPYVVRVQGLNPNDYATIVKSLRASGETLVAEACIPAGIIAFQVPDGWSIAQSFAEVEATVSSKTSLEGATLLDGVTLEQFRQTCRDARLGIQGQ